MASRDTLLFGWVRLDDTCMHGTLPIQYQRYTPNDDVRAACAVALRF